MTVANNKIVVKGVDLAEYQLEETKSPHGYAKLSAPKKFEVKEGQTVLVEVENTAGHTLPSTGGMGHDSILYCRRYFGDWRGCNFYFWETYKCQ